MCIRDRNHFPPAICVYLLPPVFRHNSCFACLHCDKNQNKRRHANSLTSMLKFTSSEDDSDEYDEDWGDAVFFICFLQNEVEDGLL